MPRQKSWMRLAAVAVLFAALHFGWEMAQSRWFSSMEGLPFWKATSLCARATLGDLAITAISFALAAAAGRSLRWPVNRRYGLPAAIFILTGLTITAGYEMFALSSGRWRYSDEMPTLGGIGLLPLLQWLLLPLVELAVMRRVWKHKASLTAGSRTS